MLDYDKHKNAAIFCFIYTLKGNTRINFKVAV